MISRATPDGSWVEIAERKEALRFELSARGHFYEPVGFIISSVGGFYETGEPTILPPDVPNFELGRCLCNHLLQFQLRGPEGAHKSKPSDWGAYRASGAKSIKSFERKAWMIAADTQNSALLLSVSPRLSLYPEVYAQGSSNFSHDQIGATTRRALRAAMVLRDAEII